MGKILIAALAVTLCGCTADPASRRAFFNALAEANSPSPAQSRPFGAASCVSKKGIRPGTVETECERKPGLYEMAAGY